MMPITDPVGDSRDHHNLAYTRADAIADGLLVEVPLRLSRQFGFTVPLAFTGQAWFDAVAWDAEAEALKPRPTGQHESGRIAEVLWVARLAATTNPAGCGHDIPFTIHRVPPLGKETRALRLTLRLSHHTGDHGEPVATIGHPAPERAGAFRLCETYRPCTRWFAVAFDDPTPSSYVSPVVTPDTLDGLLAESIPVLGIDVTPAPLGTVHVRHRAGHTTTLRPDADGHYHLQHLRWPFIRVNA